MRENPADFVMIVSPNGENRTVVTRKAWLSIYSEKGFTLFSREVLRREDVDSGRASFAGGPPPQVPVDNMSAASIAEHLGLTGTGAGGSDAAPGNFTSSITAPPGAKENEVETDPSVAIGGERPSNRKRT